MVRKTESAFKGPKNIKMAKMHFWQNLKNEAFAKAFFDLMSIRQTQFQIDFEWKLILRSNLLFWYTCRIYKLFFIPQEMIYNVGQL